MQLDSNFTKISTVEEVEYATAFDEGCKRNPLSWWTAELDGLSIKGEHIQMERFGSTPDEAIKNLFEAMSDTDVTL